jgi:hypothetical protein
VAEAAAAQAALVEADRARTDARIESESIVIDDSDERSAGSIGITAGGGALYLAANQNQKLPEEGGGAFGGQLIGHVGLWRTAPASGLASGLEVRALFRVWGTASQAPLFTTEGLATVRYFFGFFGIGVAADLRVLNLFQQSPDGAKVLFGIGPSISVALVDTRRMRVLVSLHYTPLISSDWGRVTGDFELSYRLFTLSIVGGRASDGPLDVARGGFFAAAFAGVRAAW